jgi:hypothetical protein
MKSRNCTECKCKYECYGQKAALCKKCKREYDRQYHASRSEKSKERKKELASQRSWENKKKLYYFYEKNPCVTCGESRIACLQMVHLTKNKDDKNISKMMEYSWIKIENELTRCKVVCANCVAISAAEKLGFYKHWKSIKFIKRIRQ